MTATGREPVAVLGIGAMGHGMATSALRAGIPTIVWNRRPAATRDLAGLGAEVAETAADAARRAAIVVTMVTDTDAVISIARDQGMLAALASGRGLGADEHHRRGRHRARRGHGAGRASRRDAAGRAGVGQQGARGAGPADDLRVRARRGPPARCCALFDALGQRTIWVGAVGAGSRLKLVNNTWVAFAPKRSPPRWPWPAGWGLTTETVMEALGGGPLVSPWQAAKLQRIAKGEFSAQFALSLALKDVRLALQAADDDRFAALAGLAEEWQQAVDEGLGDQDLTVVTRVLEQQGGTP